MRWWYFQSYSHEQHPRRRQYFLRPEKIQPATLRAWRARDSRAGRLYRPALGKRSRQRWKSWEVLLLISPKTRRGPPQLPLRAETCERAIQNSPRLEVGRLQHCPANWPHVEKGFAIPPAVAQPPEFHSTHPTEREFALNSIPPAAELLLDFR